MIQLPYINTRAHLHLMMERYDAHAAAYNADIRAKKQADAQNAAAYQTLKPTHRAIFKDLVLETSKKMLQHIKNYQAVNEQQGNTGVFPLLTSVICGDGVFVCSTNRYQLSKHNAKDLSTIYRNILRLMEAGIITRKVGHGKKSNFELHIKSDFLIVSDKANPDYNPLNPQKTSPDEHSFTSGENAICKEKKNVQEQLINKIYSADAVEGQFLTDETTGDMQCEGSKIGEKKPTKSSVNTFGSLLSGIAGTSTGTEGKYHAPSRENQPENENVGRENVHKLLKNKGVDYSKVFVKSNPEQWHAFHRLSHAAYFVDYLIQTIYARRGVEIFNETRLSAIEYVEKYYFPNPLQRDVETIFRPCKTIEEYTHRVNQLKWCVDAANRYAAKKGAYFVLIGKYIDITNDQGLKATFAWWKNARQNAEDKARHQKNMRDIKLLHETVRACVEEKTTLIEAENFIENHLPKYKYVFRHSLVTLVNQINR